MPPKQQPPKSQTPAGDGLRARVRKRQARAAAADGPVEFGVSQANAYFTARRIKRSSGRRPAPTQRTKITATSRNASSSSSDKAQEQEPRGGESDEPVDRHQTLVLPPHALTLAALRAADAREAARRALVPAHALPTFEQHFPLWRSQLLAKQNLLFYGVGSKLALLQRFADQFLDDGVVLQLHGYLPTVSMRYLAKFLHHEILRVHVRGSRSIVQQCQDVVKFAQKDSSRVLPRVYLVVHSIDGLAMRSPETQACLSWLSTAPFIRVVASIDQINGTSLWREEDALRFQWVTQALNTCLPYADEVELRLSKQAKTADQSSSGVRFILQSLTPTDVATLRVIAQHQLDARAPTEGASFSRRKAAAPAHADYQKVYEVCRKKLLHATLLAMKNSIKCLEEHGLVKLLRVRNSEKLEIPLPEHLVRTEILLQTADAAATARPQQLVDARITGKE